MSTTDVIDGMQRLSRLLCKESTAIKEIAAVIGPIIEEHWGGRITDVAPANPSLERASILCKSATAPPTTVHLYVASAMMLPLRALCDAFGRYDLMVGPPGLSDLRRVHFMFRDDDLPHRCFIMVNVEHDVLWAGVDVEDNLVQFLSLDQANLP